MTKNRKRQKPIIFTLLQGNECDERFEIILSLTSIRSKPMIKALHDYYVMGRVEEMIVVDAGNFNRAKYTMNVVAGKIERIKELDGVINGNS